MSEFKESLEKIERLLNIAQSHSPDSRFHNLYDFLGIDRTDSKEKIKASIEQKYNFYRSKQNDNGFDTLATLLITSLPAIEYVLSECQSEYDKHLVELKLKQLRNHFLSITRANHELSNHERKQIINKALAIGLTEVQANKIIELWMKNHGIKPAPTSSSYRNDAQNSESSEKTYYDILGIPDDASYLEIKKAFEAEYQRYHNSKDEMKWKLVAKAWETLKDPDKRKAYDKKIDKHEVKYENPALRVICKKESCYVFKGAKKGTIFTETVVIKNDHEGPLKGRVFSDAEWLVPEKENLSSENEQTLEIQILTSKIPANCYDAAATVTIDTNGGPPFSIPFRVILEDLDIAVGKFRNTYVPLISAFAGFIASMNSSPLTGSIPADSGASAIVAATIFYVGAKSIVQTSQKHGLNIFKFRSFLMQASAGAIALLALLPLSGMTPGFKQESDRQKLEKLLKSEKPLLQEQLPQLPGAKENPAIQADHFQPSNLADNTLPKEALPLSGKVIHIESKAADSNSLWRFSFEAKESKTRYDFACAGIQDLHFRVGKNDVDWVAGIEAMKSLPTDVTLYLHPQDWDAIHSCINNSHCENTICPVSIIIDANSHLQQAPNQPPPADTAKNSNIKVESTKILTKNTRQTANKGKKKRKPKIRSFAPPSRDNL